MKNYAASLKIKILISLASLMAALLCLEIGMRVAGDLYLAQRATGDDPETPDNKYEFQQYSTKILCTGDSFTFGGEGDFSDAYPAHLQRMINDQFPKQSISVINKGICEANSSRILSELPSMISSYKPDAIILLVGSANRFNTWHSRVGRDTSIIGDLKRFFHRLRVVKMAKILWLNIEARAISDKDEVFLSLLDDDFNFDRLETATDKAFFPVDLLRAFNGKPETNEEKIWNLHNSGKTQQAITFAKSFLKKDPENSPMIMISLGYIQFDSGKKDEALNTFRELSFRYPKSAAVQNEAAKFFSDAGDDLVAENHPDEAIEFYLESIRVDPFEHINYYNLLKTFELQSQYSAKHVIDRLETLKKDRPILKLNSQFAELLDTFRDRKNEASQIRQWLRMDLEDMITLCKSKNVRLILQSYPVSYPNANDVLFEMATKHNLPIVNNTAVFEKLEPRNRYLLDDDHCTSDGHDIMAENVLRVLSEEGIIGNEKAPKQKPQEK